MGKSGIGPIFPRPVHRAPVRTSCQKPTPAAFPLCLFQEIFITRLRLHSVPRPLFKLIFSGLLCVLTTFLADVLHFDASCLLICHSQEKNSTCLSRLSVFSRCGGSRTASEYALLYNTWAVTCFWLCYSVHLTSPRRSSTRRLAMFVSLWCTSDLPTPYERKWCMTKIYFWCFSSSEQYFLCLIKYVFWLAPFAFIILILTDTAHKSDGPIWNRRATLCERAAV